MSKISITEKFAQDAINAPALVTGGKKYEKYGGNFAKNKKNKSGSKKSGSKKSGSGSGNNGGGCGCYVPSPCKS